MANPILAAFLAVLSSTPDAGTPAPKCTPVVLEFVNHADKSVRFLAFYEVDGKPHSVGQGQGIPAGKGFTFYVPECIGPKSTFRLSVEAFGISTAQEATVLGSLGRDVRCRAVVEGKALSLSCRPE